MGKLDERTRRNRNAFEVVIERPGKRRPFGRLREYRTIILKTLYGHMMRRCGLDLACLGHEHC
jgi:hypothetical protein